VKRLAVDLAEFARAAVASEDIDPAYPVLKRLQADLPDDEARLWSSLCFVATYRLASSIQVAAVHPEPVMWAPNLWSLPTGVERRGLRGGTPMARHVASVLDWVESYGSIRAWLTHGFTGDKALRANWTAVRDAYGAAFGNGRWATYKLAEVLKEVNGWPIEAPDMGNDGSTGPRAGLEMLFGPVQGNARNAIAVLDAQGWGVQQYLAEQSGLSLPIEQVETVLCDFHALATGRYYVGHDIDVMLADISKDSVPEWVKTAVLSARSDVLPGQYLGERHGWTGVDAARKRVYRDEGRIVVR
jgi:hypothetical protein